MGSVNTSGVDFESFYNLVKDASVLDGDVVLTGGKSGAQRLKKINFGGEWARKLTTAGSDRNTTSTVQQNQQVREAFRVAVENQLKEWGLDDSEIKTMMDRVRTAMGGADNTKPLSRRVIRAVMGALTPEAGKGAEKLTASDKAMGRSQLSFKNVTLTKQVGAGDKALTLTKKQFDGMMDQALNAAKKRLIKNNIYAKLTSLCAVNKMTKAEFTENILEFNALISSGNFPKAKALMLRPMPQQIDYQGKTVDDKKALAAACREIVNAILEEGVSSAQFDVLTALVDQAKTDYDIGRFQSGVADLLAQGDDLASLRDSLIARAHSNAVFIPRSSGYVLKSEDYDRHELHAAPQDTCDNMMQLEKFTEARGQSAVEKIVKFKPEAFEQKGADKVDSTRPDMKFWAELLINEDPLETEISQLSGGERLARVFLQPANLPYLQRMCTDVAMGRPVTLPTPLDRALPGEDKSALGQALETMCRTINDKVFNLKKAGQSGYRFDVSRLLKSPAELLAAVKNAQVETAIGNTLRAITQENVVQPILDGLGLNRQGDNEPELSIQEKMLKLFVTTTFEKANPVQLRQLFVSGFRNNQTEQSFNPLATLFAAGPLLQKMLQALDTSHVSESALPILRQMCDVMPSITESVVRAELFSIVQKSKNDAQPIASIDVEKTLGAATIGQVFKCTVNFENGTSRKCVLKLMRPGVGETFANEAKMFRAAVKTLMNDDNAVNAEAAKELNAIFTTMTQTIKKETHFDNEMAAIIKGVRAYAKKGGDTSGIDSMLPLLKDASPEGARKFIAAVKDAKPFNKEAIQKLIETYCMTGSSSALLLTLVEGETLLDFTRTETAKINENLGNFVQKATQEDKQNLDYSGLAQTSLKTHENPVKGEKAPGPKPSVPNSDVKKPNEKVAPVVPPNEYKAIWNDLNLLRDASKNLSDEIDTINNARNSLLEEIQRQQDKARTQLESVKSRLAQFENTEPLIGPFVTTFGLSDEAVDLGATKGYTLEDFDPSQISPENLQMLMDVYFGPDADASTQEAVIRNFGPRPVIPSEESVAALEVKDEAPVAPQKEKYFFESSYKRDHEEWEEKNKTYQGRVKEYNEAKAAREKAIRERKNYDNRLVTALHSLFTDVLKDQKEEFQLSKAIETSVLLGTVGDYEAKCREDILQLESEIQKCDEATNEKDRKADEDIAPLKSEKTRLDARIDELRVSVRAENPVPGVQDYESPENVRKIHMDNLSKSITQAETNVQEMWNPIKNTQRDLQDALVKLADGLVNGKPPFLQGDSHSGNIMRTTVKTTEGLEDAVLTFIDYGRGTEVSEQEAHAMARLLAVAARPEYDLSEVAVDAYLKIIGEVLEQRKDLQASSDPNDQAEWQLLQETRAVLKNPRQYNQLVFDAQQVLSGGTDAMSRVAAFCEFLAHRGLVVPTVLQTFTDTVVKTFNAEREIELVTEKYQQAAKQTQLEVAANYLNSVVDEMAKLESPILNEHNEKQLLFPRLSIKFTPELLSELTVYGEGDDALLVNAEELKQHPNGDLQNVMFMRDLLQQQENTTAHLGQVDYADDLDRRFDLCNMVDRLDDLDTSVDAKPVAKKAEQPSAGVVNNDITLVSEETIAKNKKLLEYHVKNLKDLILNVVRELDKDRANGGSGLFKSEKAIANDFKKAAEGGIMEGDAKENGEVKDVSQKIDDIILSKAREKFSDDEDPLLNKVVAEAGSSVEGQPKDQIKHEARLRHAVRGALLTSGQLTQKESVDTVVRDFWKNYRTNMQKLVGKARKLTRQKFDNTLSNQLAGCDKAIQDGAANLLATIQEVLSVSGSKPKLKNIVSDDILKDVSPEKLVSPEGLKNFVEAAKKIRVALEEKQELQKLQENIAKYVGEIDEQQQMQKTLKLLQTDPTGGNDQEAQKLRAEIKQASKDDVLGMTEAACDAFAKELDNLTDRDIQASFWRHFGSVDPNKEITNVGRVVTAVLQS